MPRPRAPVASQPADEAGKNRVEIKLASARDVPVQYANQVVVNYVNGEFIVTMFVTVPEPWIKGGSPPRVLEAKPIARFVFGVHQWAAAVKSFQDQIANLQVEGAFKLEQRQEDEG